MHSRLWTRRSGRGVSQQAWRLGPKILEAEAWVTGASIPVWEIHPEVSFTVLLGHPPTSAKTKWAGLWERLEALQRAGVDLGGVGDAGRKAGVDDVLGAAVAAWSATRLLRNAGRSIPSPPERDYATKRDVAIWA
jgi:predicted RNase H-like nuclease